MPKMNVNLTLTKDYRKIDVSQPKKQTQFKPKQTQFPKGQNRLPKNLATLLAIRLWRTL